MNALDNEWEYYDSDDIPYNNILVIKGRKYKSRLVIVGHKFSITAVKGQEINVEFPIPIPHGKQLVLRSYRAEPNETKLDLTFTNRFWISVGSQFVVPGNKRFGGPLGHRLCPFAAPSTYHNTDRKIFLTSLMEPTDEIFWGFHVKCSSIYDGPIEIYTEFSGWLVSR